MPKTPARVVVVDADPVMRRTISKCLADEEFDVEVLSNCRQLTNFLKRQTPDMVLVEIDLEKEAGLNLMREIRQSHPAMGIIIVSINQDIADRVIGLEIGADDYVMKPFHERELLARVRSVWRRCQIVGVPQPLPGIPAIDGEYRFAGWVLDMNSRTLLSPDGAATELTGGLFDLLAIFAARPNRVLSRDQLKELIGSSAAAPFDRSIDVQIGRLRRRIERDPRRPAILKTVRNLGYMLAADTASRYSNLVQV
jgi:DNA-binding response OmpR family regulator